ncbi:MAG TPA: hypothetical protein VGK67_25960 [Myxococcales bacterium]|jgi:succinate dehydrogenase / fumarate reductase cytochrome b subunit
MAELASSATPFEAAGAARDRSYLWRRLHSLTGILPVGLFMLFHLFENLAAIGGPRAYDSGIAHLASLLPVPYFYAVEIFVLALPIAFHGLFGAYLSLEGRPNVGAYPYRRNYYYLLQRVTGVLALVYLAYHVYSLRIAVTLAGKGGGVEGHPGYVSFQDMVRHYQDPLVLWFYVLGTLSCAYHFSNGLNGFCWTWGIAVGERARKVVEWVGLGLFAVLAVPFLHILWSFYAARP